MDLLSLSWWFNTIPLYSALTLRLFFIVSLSLVILGAVVRMVSKKRIKDALQLEVLRRIATLLVVMGSFGVWYWFVAFQQIPFLSARFWTIVWVICVVAWLLSILRYVKKTVPAQREKRLAAKEQDKYMQPKRKK
ncbi:hypothetical protein HOI83_02010 [Candidatus Uhrbacteria bacterium]|jgi:hypothetical protein|nr:hypothetical protein [Candidatus Uhrbacteria bacterium]